MYDLTIPRDMKKGEKLKIYEPIDAQFYLDVSERTLNRYRRKGFLQPAGNFGRGNQYTKENLDECLINLGRDRENINVEVIYGNRQSEGN